VWESGSAEGFKGLMTGRGANFLGPNDLRDYKRL
jgi:hypothetical protein